MDGTMIEAVNRRARGALRKVTEKLRRDEAIVLAILQQRLAKGAKGKKAA